jgi:hypothetical protein
MELPEEIKNYFGGNPFLNIADETCCFFCPASIRLIKLFQKYPLLYAAMVEGVKCAKQGYYAAGILVFSQLLKEYSHSEPEERQKVAHKFLRQPPNEQDYQSVREMLLDIATKQMIEEFYRYKNKGINYKEELEKEWRCLMNGLKIN